MEGRGSSPGAADFPTDVVAARWDSTPAVKSAVTTDVWLVRGGLRHPVSLVADEIPPNVYLLEWCVVLSTEEEPILVGSLRRGHITGNSCGVRTPGDVPRYPTLFERD